MKNLFWKKEKIACDTKIDLLEISTAKKVDVNGMKVMKALDTLMYMIIIFLFFISPISVKMNFMKYMDKHDWRIKRDCGKLVTAMS